MFFVLLTLIFLLGFFLIVKKVQNENGQQNLPPGPWGLPFLGHLVSLGLNPHLKLMKWKEKYGPIIQIRFGSFLTVVLSDSKLIREAFNMNEFSGRPKIQVYEEAKAAKGLVLSEGSYNSELRHFAIRKLKEFGAGRNKLEDKIHEGISEFMDFIKMRDGLPIKSEHVPSSHIIKTLWSILMTDEMNPQDIEHMNILVSKIAKIGPVLSELAGFMPWMEKTVRILSFGYYSLISERAQQIQEMLSFMSKLVEEKKQNLARGQIQGQGQAPIDIMEMYLEKVKETTDKSSPFHASHDSAAYFPADIFSGGIHTIHTALVWLLYYAAKHPEVQLKLQEEIDQVMGHSDSRVPSLADRGQMPYADAVIHEILRMGSVVPLLLPHNTMADVSFHGYTIKKDSMIFANAYGVHHDPEIWGDPENFRPERWLGEQGKKLKSENFLAFSTGRRICPGEALAREQLFLYITTLFQKYVVKFDLDQVPEVKGVMGIFLEPSNFTIVFSQRQQK